ncbi:MAG: hypothetical protein R3F59_23475 [Myxococcota bacterium]
MLTAGQPLRPALAATSPEAVAAELERLSAQRPLVVGLLHAHDIPNAAALIAGAAGAGPVLCVATVPAPTPAALRAARPRSGSGRCLRPRSRSSSRRCGRSRRAGAGACGAAEGRPGRALQMVRRLAEDRAARPAARPARSAARWRRRRRRVGPAPQRRPAGRAGGAPVGAAGGVARPAERAAVRVLEQLGTTTVDAWAAACRAADIADAERTLERLARTGWIDVEGGSLRLAEGLGAAR